MDPQNAIRAGSRDVPAIYRVMRAVVRLGLWVFFPRLRVLNRERLEQLGPAILLSTHPRSLAAALYLISAFDRQVHCLLPSEALRNPLRRLATWALGMQAFDFTGEDQETWLNPCLDTLDNQDAIALFTGPASKGAARRPPLADFAARLTVEAALRGQSGVQPAIYPLHWLLGSDRRQPDILMCIDRPILAQDFLPTIGESLTTASQQLVDAVQAAVGANIFGLSEEELINFSGELENLSREQLAEQWAGQPDWKQRPEDLQLSRQAIKWVAEQNRSDPAKLVELREALDDYGEARRQCSMEELVVESSGLWQDSAARLAAAWLETVLGFPVALYGFLNHLPAIIALAAGGLFKNSPRRDPKVEWLLRSFIVLTFYTIQVFLIHYWWGRATAGYYALSLPASGAYLWRYDWLLRHRAHVLFHKVLQPFRRGRVERARDSIINEFNHELEQSAHAAGTHVRGLAE